MTRATEGRQLDSNGMSKGARSTGPAKGAEEEEEEVGIGAAIEIQTRLSALGLQSVGREQI